MISKLLYRSRNQQGFTLVELLVAVAIVAIIGTTLTITINQLFMVQAADKNHTEAVKQVENALHYINRDAQMAWPSLIKPDDNNQYRFINTTLNLPVTAGVTTINVVNAADFPPSGTIVIGEGSNTEILDYSSRTGTSINLDGAVAFSHDSGEQVYNALGLCWETFADDTNYNIAYILGNSAVNSIFRRIEKKEGVTSPTSLPVAKYIDMNYSWFSFDGNILTISLTAITGGYKSATETRSLQVETRTTN